MASKMSRRSLLKGGLCAAGLAGLACRRGQGAAAQADEEIGHAERGTMAETAIGFMKKNGVPGLSIAIASGDKPLCQQSFGVADRDTHEPLSSSSLFRIASVTKSITSVAIFTLIEQGRVNLSDKIFGKGRIFGTDYGTPPYRQYVEDIILDHLLTHTCGGWQGDWGDPMFRNPDMDHAQLISWT